MSWSFMIRDWGGGIVVVISGDRAEIEKMMLS
jgi:hypothetical protein